MRLFKTLLKVFAATSLVLVLVYFVAGYFALGYAFKHFQTRGQMKEDQTLLFSAEKNLTDEEKIKVAEFKKTLSKEDLADLESVKKEFAVPKKTKSKKKKARQPVTSEDIERMHEMDDLITFADEIVKENPNFNPCESVCGVSAIRRPSSEGEEGEEIPQSRGDFAQRIREFYGQSEKLALKDPAFNYVVLFLANMRSVMPKDFSDFMFKVMSMDPKDIESDPVLKAKILVQLPLWVYRMKRGLEEAEVRHIITKNFLDIHQSCKKGKVKPAEARQQCSELFEDYDLAK